MSRTGLVVVLLGILAAAAAAAESPRPNILWITCEDISPHLGCYGDTYAVTPHLDQLAREAVRFTQAFAPIGVCAPARSCLILGMYPPAVGTHHMRCTGLRPDFARCFSEYLRDAGYFCTNNVKTDYNFPPPKAAWDELSNQAHWRHRRAGQPFFAVFNFTTSHESQIRLPEAQYRRRLADFQLMPHDPARAPIPPYHPDAPEVRRDWARYADMISVMDRQVGGILRQLADDGLTDDTIVFFFSDHGAGMPRSKRWLYDSSLRVPLLIRFPKKYAHWAPAPPGSTTERMVSFVDFAPTVLSLAGVPIPKHMHGQPFLGPKAVEPRTYVFGFRDRMDERIDMIRAVRDRRYKYIRNYHPELPWFREQHISYMYEMPTMRVWQQLADAGKLSGPPAIFMAATKPAEELYDILADPHEVHNLADSPTHRETLHRLRKVLGDWQAEIIDLGFLPEADLRTRFGSKPPYTEVRREPSLYPYARIAAAADLASRPHESDPARLNELLRDSDPAVRYWAATGLGACGDRGKAHAKGLKEALQDSAPWVRVAAADALCRLGEFEPAVVVLTAALTDANEWVRLQAINVLDRLGERARSAAEAIDKARKDPNQYVVRVAEHAAARLKP
ncbi:MAG: sulfatase-like hydrolase/transferase [Gemmataceae bacterium]|nr:sulfatase-like hydrolase/transferase [Gemmataceae bacterium]MDW8266750.1 sulfatase-like hydrolase/transferase [Gemmataceae bacterium]